jgi:hypothetical protein
MENLGALLNKYRLPVLATTSTAVLGIFLALLAGPESDYILFINICLTLAFIYLLYRLLFKPDNSYSFLFLSCNLILIICANHFYSYKELVNTFTALQYIDPSLLYIIVVVIVASLFLFLRFISLVSRGSGIKARHYTDSNSGNIANKNTKQQPENEDDLYIQPNTAFDKRRMLSVGAITLVAMILLAIICVVIYCFLVLVENGTGVEKLDMYELVATCTSYGMTFLFIITAIFFILVILIELASYILKKIKALLNINNNPSVHGYASTAEKKQQVRQTSDIKVPTYALSILIFFSLLYLAYKIGGQTLQDFFKAAAKGDYLVLPLTLLACVVAFFILVRVIHGILLFTLKAKRYRVEAYIIRIGKLIVSIIFRTIIIALKFVKFVPDFFEALHDMVLSDDEETTDDGMTNDSLTDVTDTYGYSREEPADYGLTEKADNDAYAEAAATAESVYDKPATEEYYKKADNKQEEEGI